jgi:hypothetical protein
MKQLWGTHIRPPALVGGWEGQALQPQVSRCYSGTGLRSNGLWNAFLASGLLVYTQEREKEEC